MYEHTNTNTKHKRENILEEATQLVLLCHALLELSQQESKWEQALHQFVRVHSIPKTQNIWEKRTNEQSKSKKKKKKKKKNESNKVCEKWRKRCYRAGRFDVVTVYARFQASGFHLRKQR